MRLGILFSGGKDSTLALHKVAKKEEIKCLITVQSENKYSYMFHTPNIEVTSLQAEALNLPLLRETTEGKPEEELKDLEKVIKQAIKDFKIDGIVTGAIESAYQSKRIQYICDQLDISCCNPLWKKNQRTILEEMLSKGFKVIISGVFAYPLNTDWLGKEIDLELIERLVQLQKKYGVSPSGEGGEIETTVLDAPLFRKRIEILDFAIKSDGDSGVFIIRKARLAPKKLERPNVIS
jgi:diphthine-ammonia ligase